MVIETRLTEEQRGGPFSTDGEGLILKRESCGKIGDPIITTKAGSAVIKALMRYPVLSRYQMSLVCGFNKTLGNTLNVMYRLGFVDRLITETTPVLYCRGPVIRDRYGIKKLEWRLPELFRLAAATQVSAQLAHKGVEHTFQASDEAATTAILTINDVPYVLLAPRDSNLELQWCDLAIHTHGIYDKIIVVTATQDMALEIGENLFYSGPDARFTWDSVLKDRVAFYEYTPKGFKVEKEF